MAKPMQHESSCRSAWIAALFLFPGLACAAPFFIVSDPGFEVGKYDLSTTRCVYQIGTATPVETPLVERACRVQIPETLGTFTYQLWYRVLPGLGVVTGYDGPKSSFTYSIKSVDGCLVYTWPFQGQPSGFTVC